jgi:hypothetical protein
LEEVVIVVDGGYTTGVLEREVVTLNLLRRIIIVE